MPTHLKEEVKQIQIQYGDIEGFMIAFNPEFQLKVASNKRRAFAGVSPILAKLKYAYSEELIRDWIVVHLENLNDFCGVSLKMSLDQMNEVASIIQVEYPFLKVSELLLFLHEFKTGKYGELYGVVDPIKITTALKRFIAERREAISRIEAEERSKELQKPKSGISREAYEELKNKAKTSPEAFERLFRSFPNGEVLKYWKRWLVNPAETEKYLIEFNLRRR